MRAGSRRELVVVEAPPASPQRAADGAVVEEWIQHSRHWAAVEDLSARETREARQVNEHVSHRVTMEYFPELTGQHRLRWTPFRGKERILHVAGATHSALHNETVALCEEVVGAEVRA